MKLVTACVSMMLCSSAVAQSARVIAVEPRFATVTERVCHIESVAVTQPHTPGGVLDGPAQALRGDGDALAGAIIGGVIGNKLAGNDKGTGTTLGVIIGSNMANGTSRSESGTVRYVDREVCRSVPRQVQRGEIVTFEYQGRQFRVTFD